MKNIDFFKINRREIERTRHSNVFIMMRYVNESPYLEIEEAIKDSLKDYNLRGILAKDVACHPELWKNICFCMENSSYGIAVFERITQPDYNPNVELEMGYMLAKKNPCLILKEKSLPKLNTDIIGHLYQKFDSHRARETLVQAVKEWLDTLGLRSLKSAQTITARNPLEANKKRTERIIEALRSVTTQKTSKNQIIIRQAASLSSLAISDNERHDSDKDNAYQQLLIEERNTLENLLEKGLKVRLIICPEAQIERVELCLVKKKYAQENIIPRYDRLIERIKHYIDNKNLQIVHTLRLPHDNLIIINDDVIFIGRKRRRERGFPYTTEIYDPTVLKDEISEFDIIFSDNVSAILKSKLALSERYYSSSKLKIKVIEKLRDSKYRLVNILKKR